jgi:hypothetical protein
MNEDYLNLGYSLDALVIACVNYGDPTRIHVPQGGNPWLEKICTQLIDFTTFSSLAKAAGALVQAQVLAPPVNPASSAPQSPLRK